MVYALIDNYLMLCILSVLFPSITKLLLAVSNYQAKEENFCYLHKTAISCMSFPFLFVTNNIIQSFSVRFSGTFLELVIWDSVFIVCDFSFPRTRQLMTWRISLQMLMKILCFQVLSIQYVSQCWRTCNLRRLHWHSPRKPSPWRTAW